MRSTDSEYHMQYVAGAQMFVDSLPEGTAEVQILACEGDDNKQINDVNALIAAKGDNMILFIDANNAPNIVPIAEACEEAGVYWCAAWNSPEGVLPTSYDYWVTFQSCDAVDQGYQIAKCLFDSLPTPGEGKICVLEGMLANTANSQRMEGLKKALEEYPGIEVLDDQAADWQTDLALSTTESWLSKYGEEIDGIWCACDDMAVGVVQALKAKGLNGKILTTGVDGTSASFDLVESGDLACTIANNGWLQASYGVAYAYAAKTGEIVPSELDNTHRMFLTSGTLVTPENLAEFKAEYIDSTPDYDFSNLDYPIAGPMFPEAE
jgi:ribose transport system substrate-binding protein